MKSNKLHNGISPVIGTILLVGVTVALVSLVSVVAFDTIDSAVSETADAEVTMSFQQNAGAGRIGYLSAEVIRNQNVENIVVKTPNGNSAVVSNVGDQTNLTVESEGTAFARAQDQSFNEVISSINIQV